MLQCREYGKINLLSNHTVAVLGDSVIKQPGKQFFVFLAFLIFRCPAEPMLWPNSVAPWIHIVGKSL